MSDHEQSQNSVAGICRQALVRLRHRRRAGRFNVWIKTAATTISAAGKAEAAAKNHAIRDKKTEKRFLFRRPLIFIADEARPTISSIP